MNLIVQQLKDEFQDSDCVWFFVDINYRILAFNKKAAENSLAFHKKQIAPGQSILDYARDTKNRIDSKFIQCFGKAASGHPMELEHRISYEAATIVAKSVYTPVLQNERLEGVSITVHYRTATE